MLHAHIHCTYIHNTCVNIMMCPRPGEISTGVRTMHYAIIFTQCVHCAGTCCRGRGGYKHVYYIRMYVCTLNANCTLVHLNCICVVWYVCIVKCIHIQYLMQEACAVYITLHYCTNTFYHHCQHHFSSGHLQSHAATHEHECQELRT